MLATSGTNISRDGRTQPPPSDGVRIVREDVADAEALGAPIAQRADPEGLGRVVAGRDEVDACLARLRVNTLGGLAGQEGVEPGLDRAADVARGPAGDDPDRPDRVGP